MEAILEKEEVEMNEDKKYVSDILYSAIEMQEYARKNHAVTLTVKECIELVNSHELNITLKNIDKSLKEIISIGYSANVGAL